MRFVWACCVSVCFSILLLLTACSSIDEDLSDCGYDYEMVYELQLVTNISTRLTSTGISSTTAIVRVVRPSCPMMLCRRA